jgi:hypothetical protein
VEKWKGGLKLEYRVLDRVQSTEDGLKACTSGRDAVAPLPAGGARERQLGWHAVPTLPEATRAARGAVPTFSLLAFGGLD